MLLLKTRFSLSPPIYVARLSFFFSSKPCTVPNVKAIFFSFFRGQPKEIFRAKQYRNDFRKWLAKRDVNTIFTPAGSHYFYYNEPSCASSPACHPSTPRQIAFIPFLPLSATTTTAAATPSSSPSPHRPVFRFQLSLPRTFNDQPPPSSRFNIINFSDQFLCFQNRITGIFNSYFQKKSNKKT